jgi:hypothetical protein
MKSLSPDETQIVGGWSEREGSLEPDAASMRINELIASGELEELAGQVRRLL